MLTHALQDTLHRIENAAQAAGRPRPRLLAVSKTQPADAIAGLAALGQLAFGENYVQEAVAKQAEIALMSSCPALEWHLIGHLQTNKARDAASRFDWVQSVDRERLVLALNAHRPPERGPLDVLVQVNVDDEASKHGCRPEDVARLAVFLASGESAFITGETVAVDGGFLRT